MSTDEKTGIEEEYSPETNYSYINNTVGYMTGFIVRSILRQCKCYSCPLVLTDDTSHTSLIGLKNRGGLVKPSKDILKICQIIEKKFRLHYKSKKGIYRYLSFFKSNIDLN